MTGFANMSLLPLFLYKARNSDDPDSEDQKYYVPVFNHHNATLTDEPTKISDMNYQPDSPMYFAPYIKVPNNPSHRNHAKLQNATVKDKFLGGTSWKPINEDAFVNDFGSFFSSVSCLDMYTKKADMIL